MINKEKKMARNIKQIHHGNMPSPKTSPTPSYPTWLFVVLYTLQVLILVLTIILLIKTPKPFSVPKKEEEKDEKKKEEKDEKKEKFCNCFGAQYDGSIGNPSERSCYGGYCYDRPKMSAEYAAGAFSKTFQGV